MARRTRAAHLPVDTLSTRALSLCRLPFFFLCGDYLTSRCKEQSPLRRPGTVGMALPIPPGTGCRKTWGLDISRCLFGFS